MSLGNEKDSVYRQMGERHREQMRVKILRLGILEKSTFKKKIFQVCVRQVGCDKRDIARVLPGEFEFESVSREFKGDGF